MTDRSPDPRAERRAAALERERRERVRRERERERAGAARPSRAGGRSAARQGAAAPPSGGRSTATAGRSTPARARATTTQGPGGAVAVRPRDGATTHEGLLPWVARSIGRLPRTIGSGLRGFGREVVAVVGGAVRVPAVLVSRVLPGRTVRANAVAVAAPADDVRAEERTTGRARTVGRATRSGALPRPSAGSRGGRPARTGALAGSRTGLDAHVPDLGVPAPRSARQLAQDRARERRRTLRRRRLRGAAASLALILVVTAWLTLPSAEVFRIRHIEVVGTSTMDDLEVRQRVDSALDGHTIYDVDADEVARRLERLPFVRDVRVDRHFPGGLSLHISEYRPLAVGTTRGGGSWLVARDGRVLARARIQDWRGRVPIVRMLVKDPSPGDMVGKEPALQVVAALGPDATIRFVQVDVHDGAIVGVLENGVEIRFGRAERLRVKLAVAQRYLDLAALKGQDLAYVEVSVPERPATCERSDTACSDPAPTPAELEEEETARARAAGDGDDAAPSDAASRSKDAADSGTGTDSGTDTATTDSTTDSGADTGDQDGGSSSASADGASTTAAGT